MDDFFEFKYSNSLIYSAKQFISAAEKELGGISKKKVYAMLDAFDPELKDDIIMSAMLTGRTYGNIAIELDKSIPSGNGYKIQAIKSIRIATGLGLKEAKDITDFASEGQTVELNRFISHELDWETYDILKRSLDGTGYKVL